METEMQMEELQKRGLLVDGVQALLVGRRMQARELLLGYLEQNERDDEAWLWLSGAMDEIEDVQVALENSLDCNPANIQAQHGLDWLRQYQADRES